MEKINRINKPEMACVMDIYNFNGEMIPSNITKFVNILTSSGVGLCNFRLSNSERENEHFFRTFLTLNEFNDYNWDDDCIIDDFGVSCMYKGVVFHLTFDFNKDHILVFHQDNINFEPLLLSLENGTKKKNR